MRFGGVFVRMSTLSSVRTPSTMHPPTSVSSIASGSPIIHPKTPPAPLRAGSPSRGCGRPPAIWQKPAMVTTKRPKPMPIRPLSCTEDGWRNIHPARNTRSTGMTNATRPTSPPTEKALMAAPASVPMKNHSTTAPITARRTSRSGRPSRRWSFSSVSGPNARNRPPTPWASPIHARTVRAGLSSSPT